MDSNVAIEAMLKNLDRWRHLPKYQMERRADLFFSLFIKEIVQGSNFTENKRLHNTIFPEFPYKNSSERNTTVNFDYVMFSEDLKSAFILELKTDPNSASDSNNSYLEKLDASTTMFSEIITDIFMVSTKSKHKSKYKNLFIELERIGIIERCGDIGWQCKHQISKPIIIYLAPGLKKTDSAKIKLIDFHEAAATLEKIGNGVEKQFAKYLRQWQDITAGDHEW